MTRKRIFFFCSLIIFSLLTIEVPAAFSAEPPDYNIQATINTDKKMISAVQTVTVMNTSSQPWDSLYFHIYANRKYSTHERKVLLNYASYFKVNPYPEGFQEGKVDIRSVTQDNQDVSFKIEGSDQTLLRIALPKSLGPGETARVNIQYTVLIPHAYGRFGWHENITTLSRWYPILSVYGEKGLPATSINGQAGWANYPFYPYHRPFFSEAARYSVELTVPADDVVIHSGELVSETRIDERFKKLTIDSKLPIRDFSLSMSPDYQVKEGTFEDTQIKAYYLPGTKEHGEKALKVVEDLMKYYSGRFGAYPYKTFSVAPVYLGYGGEQTSNMLYIDTRVFQLPKILDRYFDFLVAHETGHQWFYNLVGMDEYSEMWLEEGVHSYFILQYLKNKYGDNPDIVQLPGALKNFRWMLPELTFESTRDVRYKIISRIGLDEPVVGELSSFQEPSSIFALTYGKGADIVDMLEHLLGKEAFDKVFTRVFKEYRFKNLAVRDFIRLCQEESGQDLNWFFSQWLYTKEQFDAGVDGVRGNRIVLRNKGGIEMPVDVKVNYSDGKSDEFIWDTRKERETVPVKTDQKIKSVELDPQEKTLDIDRTNNNWPRRLNIKPVPFYLGLYDIYALMPDKSYNLVFGPEAANGGFGVKASFQKPYEQNFYAGSDYEFGEQILHSRVGYELDNIRESPTALGFEIANQTDYKDGDDDLVSGKVFIRRELRPVPYSAAGINDHVSLYMVRNQSLNNTLLTGGAEDSRNISYLKHSEAIVGVNLHLEKATVQPDPSQGYKIDAMVENSGHFLGATQYFNRAAVDASLYHPVTLKSKLALRVKYGWGEPDDKNLYQLGGWDGLRGYDRKDVRGSNALLGSLEYRFPLRDGLNVHLFDNIIGFESLGAVMFVDAGESWYDDWGDARLRKDAGMGLRLTMNFGSFLERVVIRADVAQAINENKNDPHVWFGINHAF